MSLIRGAKGSGKSLLFRLFVEQPERARELASVYGDLSNVEFIGAHGRRALDRWIASSQVFASVEECVGDEMWRSFWPAYALLRLARTLPDLRPVIKKESSFAESLLNVLEDQNLSEEGLIQALANAVQTSAARAAANDWMQIANQWLGRQNKHAWLFYDELDAGFGHTSHDYRRRRRALEGLLAWWLEYSGPLTHIHMKCLLREDIWQELRFPNLSHYAGKDMTLQWQEEDLWRLVLRQALASSAFAREVAHLVIDREALDRLDVDQLRKALIPLWGERMGAGKAAYTYRWVLRRITDGRGSRFPRSLVLLLSQALEQERQNRQSPGKSILKPRSLVAAMDAVSMSRVQEVKEEYPELQTALEALRDSSSPMDKPGLDQVLAGFDRPPEEIIEQMLKAGILEKRKPREDNRYAIAELYLFGLGMRRKGPG